MQKKLIALAVASLAAGSAFAQTNVTISGIAAVSYHNFKISDISNPARRIATTENRLDDNTSRFTLKGTEDLGGGLSAYFQIENRVSLDTRPNSVFGNAQGLADGESFVGIKSNSLGQIGFGKFAMHYHEGIGYSETYRAMDTQAYASAGILSSINNSIIAGSTRQQNTIKYDTPNWNGFSAKAAYSFAPFGNEGTLGNTGIWSCSNQYGGAYGCVVTGPTAATTSKYQSGYAWNIAARYFNGPINAVVSVYKSRPENTSIRGLLWTATDSYKAHFDYKFAFGLQAGVGYDHTKLTAMDGVNDRSRNAWMIPISYKTGAHGVYFTYAKAGKLSGVADSGASQYTLAYDYALSKRTFAGVSYVNVSNDRNASYKPWLAGDSTLGGSTLAAGENARQISLNLTHFF